MTRYVVIARTWKGPRVEEATNSREAQFIRNLYKDAVVIPVSEIPELLDELRRFC